MAGVSSHTEKQFMFGTGEFDPFVASGDHTITRFNDHVTNSDRGGSVGSRC